MLCGSTSRTESNDIFSRLTNPPANPEHGIKLCYVTVGFFTERSVAEGSIGSAARENSQQRLFFVIVVEDVSS